MLSFLFLILNYNKGVLYVLQFKIIIFHIFSIFFLLVIQFSVTAGFFLSHLSRVRSGIQLSQRDRQLFTPTVNLQSNNHLAPLMSLDCGRKLEYPERTHAE